MATKTITTCDACNKEVAQVVEVELHGEGESFELCGTCARNLVNWIKVQAAEQIEQGLSD